MKITSSVFFTAALIFVGLNLRPVLVAIGPLLDQIRFSTGLSFHFAGLADRLARTAAQAAHRGEG